MDDDAKYRHPYAYCELCKRLVPRIETRYSEHFDPTGNICRMTNEEIPIRETPARDNAW